MLVFLSVIEDEATRIKLEKIYIKYKKLAYWTAYKILKDSHKSEDVIQDAIIKMSSLIHKIDEVGCNKTRALFVIIVRNLSINIYNKRKNMEHTHYEEFEVVAKDLSLDEKMINLDQTKWILGMLKEINPTYADILSLKYYYYYSNSEISKLLNITEGNVRVRLHRARLAIKKIIEEEDYSDGF
ncbi:RNA polymerase sigma factor [Senegalia sp. (in: firmicutes)]|uniref:RNA polymerase sigma factor n=1 Tax=Senegalia sp. (in: firmicutes) TaxID=1924098 RepID=UPI003F965808